MACAEIPRSRQSSDDEEEEDPNTLVIAADSPPVSQLIDTAPTVLPLKPRPRCATVSLSKATLEARARESKARSNRTARVRKVEREVDTVLQTVRIPSLCTSSFGGQPNCVFYEAFITAVKELGQSATGQLATIRVAEAVRLLKQTQTGPISKNSE